ncbi:MAG: PQQ-dependent sugar dehydrogenase [Actinomycetota bacterium]
MLATSRPRSGARGIARVLAVAIGACLALGALPGLASAKIVAVPVREGLEVPVGFTFAPDGRIFYTEKEADAGNGQVRIIDRAADTNTLFYEFTDVSSAGERGVLGVALHPDYPATPEVFVYVTRRPAPADPLENEIVRLIDDDGSGTSPEIIWSAPVAEPRTNHNGGRILFGPDEMLYAVVGDGGLEPGNAQDLDDDRGKVLRMDTDGNAPVDNPFAGSVVWAYGIRNSFGMAFDPHTGFLWETENGPACNDELNRIREGQNYGWGASQTCSGQDPFNTNQDGPNVVLPQRWWTPTIAPVGAVFCRGCRLGPKSRGRMFWGSRQQGLIRRTTLNEPRTRIKRIEKLLSGNNVVALEAGPSGRLFFSTFDGIYRLDRR